MFGVDILGALQDFSTVSAGPTWLAGGSAVIAASFAIRETFRRRSAEQELALCRDEISEIYAQFDQDRSDQKLWHQRYLGLASAHDDFILRRDASGRLTHMNDPFITAFGVMRNSVLGTDYHPPADSSVSGRPRGSAADPGCTRIRYQQRLNTVQGWRWIAWEDQAIRAEDGTVIEIQSTGRDITERKEARDLQRTARAAIEALRRRRQNFRQAMARDLLPITSGMARATERETPVLRALLPRIAALQDCLAFEGENIHVTRQSFEPRRLVAGVIHALAEGAPGDSGGIASLIGPEVPLCVTGDAALLTQVIERLAGPALGDGNGVCIRVNAGAGKLRLSFETPWPRQPGRGARPSELALAAVRPVVEAMGGELAIDQSDGAVSVRVEIPAPAAGETADWDTARGTVGRRPSPGTLAGSA